MSEAPRLLPGDPVPRLGLPDSDGTATDLSHQSIAGETVVLVFTEWIDAAVNAVLSSHVGSFAALESRVFIVARTAAGAAAAPVTVLIDADGRVGPAFGLAGPGVVVIGPDGRLEQAAPGSVVSGPITAGPRTAVGDALATCQALFDASAAVLAPRHAPVLVVRDAIDPALCERLIEYWEAGEKQADAVATGSQGNTQAAAQMKRRSDVFLADRAMAEALKGCLARRLVPMVRRAYQVSVTQFEAFRIGCYDAAAGGYFHRHRDNSTPYTAHRQFALTLNLNTGAYEGGSCVFRSTAARSIDRRPAAPSCSRARSCMRRCRSPPAAVLACSRSYSMTLARPANASSLPPSAPENQAHPRSVRPRRGGYLTSPIPATTKRGPLLAGLPIPSPAR